MGNEALLPPVADNMALQIVLNELRELRAIVEGLRPEADRLVSVNFVAQRLCLNPKTVRNMCMDGRIKKAVQPSGDRGEWRIPYTEYERLKNGRKMLKRKSVAAWTPTPLP